jgi:hypothetical protein
MRKNLFAVRLPALLILLLAAYAGTATAQVKQVQMHIGGYLCGN